MTRWFGCGVVVIPNLFRDLDFGLRILVLRASPETGLLYLGSLLAEMASLSNGVEV